MTTQEQRDLQRLEQSLFFNKDRILRWTRKVHGRSSLHPELDAFEAEVRAEQRQKLAQKLQRLLFWQKAKA